jgi:hypothetical protein
MSRRLINGVHPKPTYRYAVTLCDERGLEELIYLMGHTSMYRLRSTALGSEFRTTTPRTSLLVVTNAGFWLSVSRRQTEQPCSALFGVTVTKARRSRVTCRPSGAVGVLVRDKIQSLDHARWG